MEKPETSESESESDDEESDRDENSDDMEQDDDQEELEIDEEEEEDESNEEPDDEEIEIKKKKGLKEDIYGRLVDKSGKIVNIETRTRPSERLQQLLESSEGVNQQHRIKLSKQLQGLFNRLSTANMHSISNQIIQIFYSNEFTRFDIMDTILKIIITSLIRSNCLSPARLVLEHAALIFVLTNQIGIELGASLVQKLCAKLDADLRADHTYQIENKTADNLILLLCNLYNFKLFSANLIIDLLNKTLADKIAQKWVLMRGL